MGWGSPMMLFWLVSVNYSALSLLENEPANNKKSSGLPTSISLEHALFIGRNAISMWYASTQSSRQDGCWWSGAHLAPGHPQPLVCFEHVRSVSA